METLATLEGLDREQHSEMRWGFHGSFPRASWKLSDFQGWVAHMAFGAGDWSRLGAASDGLGKAPGWTLPKPPRPKISVPQITMLQSPSLHAAMPALQLTATIPKLNWWSSASQPQAPIQDNNHSDTYCVLRTGREKTIVVLRLPWLGRELVCTKYM